MSRRRVFVLAFVTHAAIGAAVFVTHILSFRDIFLRPWQQPPVVIALMLVVAVSFVKGLRWGSAYQGTFTVAVMAAASLFASLLWGFRWALDTPRGGITFTSYALDSLKQAAAVRVTLGAVLVPIFGSLLGFAMGEGLRRVVARS